MDKKTNKFTAITITGDRPQAFELCKLYMYRQTVLPAQWIIVDDGYTKMERVPSAGFVKYVRRERQVTEGGHTLTFQMVEALKHVKHDYVFTMEDDDWYCPDYFERMLGMFDEESELVGQGKAEVYHIKNHCYQQCQNIIHTSLCRSGFRKSYIKRIIELCEDIDPFLDIRMWHQSINKHLFLLEDTLCLGIKGMPGRAGIERCHTHTGGFTADPDLAYLKRKIKDDVELYRNYL